jgi:alcohol dehydrogenase (NADP+)
LLPSRRAEWEPNSETTRSHCDQGSTGSRISTFRLRGTIRKRTRGRQGAAGRTCRSRDRASADIFVTTKLWNSNHRPERVEPAFEASLDRLGIQYLDLYLIHTPFAFQAGDEQNPRDQNGNVIYDHDGTLFDTWKAMETLVDHGKCRAIGLSDIGLDD